MLQGGGRPDWQIRVDVPVLQCVGGRSNPPTDNNGPTMDRQRGRQWTGNGADRGGGKVSRFASVYPTACLSVCLYMCLSVSFSLCPSAYLCVKWLLTRLYGDSKPMNPKQAVRVYCWEYVLSYS